MKIILLFFVFSICFNNVFSQKSKKANPVQIKSEFTEYDYYEKLRLERKEKKIQRIKTIENMNDAMCTIDSFDVDGYLRKREIYTYDLQNSSEILYSTIIIERYSEEGNMNGYSITPVNSNSINNFEKIKPSYFYDIGINEETLVDDVKYIFDENNNLIEKRSFGDHLYDTGKEYESKYFYYDKKSVLTESRTPTGKNSASITKYFYNEKGLLDREAFSYDFQNDGRDYGMRYEYEFYSIGNNSPAIIINVNAYENQSTLGCIEDYIESNPLEYEGVYTFVHFGTDSYTFFIKNNEISFVWDFESLTNKENSSFTNIRFDNNWVYATESSGRDFKARFVKLKCDINSQILKGFIGLLVNEENLYLMQGD